MYKLFTKYNNIYQKSFFPEDADNEIGKIVVSAYMYVPYEFIIKPNVKNIKFRLAYKNKLSQNFKKIFSIFIKNDYYVVIGEMSIANKKRDNTWAIFHKDELKWENGNFIDLVLNASKK